MPIVRMSGGIGNQLFSVAMAVAISQQTGKAVGLDIDSYSYSGRLSNRNVAIGDFHSDNFYFCNSGLYFIRPLSKIFPSRFLSRLFNSRNRKIEILESLHGLPIQIERTLVHDPDIDTSIDSYFVGSFITPQYWGGLEEKVLEVVRELFWKTCGLSSELKSQTLNIHVRRGDYLRNPKTRRFHGLCGLDYYLENVSDFLSRYPEISTIQIFSDDFETAVILRELLDFQGAELKINLTADAYQALAEMSQSKFFIGCNSTFSWWSSVLVEGRVSVLPAQWFLDPAILVNPKYFFLGDTRISKIGLE